MFRRRGKPGLVFTAEELRMIPEARQNAFGEFTAKYIERWSRDESYNMRRIAALSDRKALGTPQVEAPQRPSWFRR